MVERAGRPSRGDRARPGRARTIRRWSTASRARRAWRPQTRGCRPRWAISSPSCTRRGGAWSRPATRSGAGSSGGCTTAWSDSSRLCRRARAGAVAGRSWTPRAGAALDHVGGAQEQLARSLVELGELARGLHPRVLAERGPGGRAGRSSPPRARSTSTSRSAGVRLAPAVEVAAYFVCSEALGQRGEVRRCVARVDRRAQRRRAPHRQRAPTTASAARDAREGGGLRGLADRVQAHGGTLRIDSRPGAGRCLVADHPSRRGQP